MSFILRVKVQRFVTPLYIYDFIKRALFICRYNKCEISVTNAAKILTLYRYIEHLMKLKAYCTIESMQKCQNLTNYCTCISLVVKNVTNTINVEIQLIDWFGNCCSLSFREYFSIVVDIIRRFLFLLTFRNVENVIPIMGNSSWWKQAFAKFGNVIEKSRSIHIWSWIGRTLVLNHKISEM